MIWRRRGLVFAPEPAGLWQSHAQEPTPLVLGPRHWRIFLGGRDRENRTRIFHVDVDPGADMAVTAVSTTPAMELGPHGAFDSAGQCVTALVRGEVQGEALTAWYIGMHLRRDVPYGLAIGRAVSRDDGVSFTPDPGPVLAAGPEDPVLTSTPFVEPDGAGFRGWHMSGTGWEEVAGAPPDPVYGIAAVTSPDGRRWHRTGPALWPEGEAAGLTRPFVFRRRGQRWMIFSRRGRGDFRSGGAAGYRLWQVPLGEDDTLLAAPEPLALSPPPAPGDWDFGMQEYAAVAPLEGGFALFYCGAEFGRHGFGWASLDL
ncbi:hypothetical protein [Pseudoroseicyclus sp. CXY001]|uniref:hypothetical protein n=1 Tax=Pseudoroseicyclus sp. CXY001 TaxID=3242492 RepID=UPI003570C128